MYQFTYNSLLFIHSFGVKVPGTSANIIVLHILQHGHEVVENTTFL